MKTLWLWVLLGLVHNSAWGACNTSMQANTPDQRFVVDAATGLVTDKATELVWQRCSLGQSGANCSGGAAATYNWQQALQAAQSSTHAGYSDWRLPNIKELASIIERSCGNPAVNTTAFPSTVNSYYWSASTFAGYSGRSWRLHFGTGATSHRNKTNSFHVRLVRGGQ